MIFCRNYKLKVSNLQRIDELLTDNHSFLESTDHCYFLGEYVSGLGFNHSEMNQLINNLKKPIERKPLLEWRHKEMAISKIASLLVSTALWSKLKLCTWVPIPPSKIKDDPQHDDCILRILKQAQQIEKNLDIRELLLAKNNREPAHLPGNKRPTLQEHLNNLIINKEQLHTPVSTKAIVIFDDIITTGASYKAAQHVLNKQFPETIIIGVFVGRNSKSS